MGDAKFDGKDPSGLLACMCFAKCQECICCQVLVVAWSRVHLLSSVGGCLVKSASAFLFLYVVVLWQVILS